MRNRTIRGGVIAVPLFDFMAYIVSRFELGICSVITYTEFQLNKPIRLRYVTIFDADSSIHYITL